MDIDSTALRDAKMHIHTLRSNDWICKHAQGERNSYREKGSGAGGQMQHIVKDEERDNTNHGVGGKKA